MGCVDEELVAFSRLRGVQLGLQLLVEKRA
jgi:hypothetical protein